MIKIYTDGSCLENPGNGGWAAIINDNGNIKRISGKEKNTTNKNNNNKCTKNPTNGHHCVIRDYAFKLSQKLYFSLK